MKQKPIIALGSKSVSQQLGNGLPIGSVCARQRTSLKLRVHVVHRNVFLLLDEAETDHCARYQVCLQQLGSGLPIGSVCARQRTSLKLLVWSSRARAGSAGCSSNENIQHLNRKACLAQRRFTVVYHCRQSHFRPSLANDICPCCCFFPRLYPIALCLRLP